MNRFSVAILLLAASASSASAGAYIGLGIGSSARATSDDTMMEGDGRSGRLMLGWHFGRISVEGAGTRYDVWVAAAPFSATQLALGAKYNLPLGNNFEVFGGGGVQRTSLRRRDGGGGYDADGNGLFLVLGAEYRLPLQAANVSLFVDYRRAWTTFDNGYGEYDGVAGLWTLGATLSF